MDIKDGHISYIEFRSKDNKRIKAFYETAFGWVFTDYGPKYTSFSESGLYGGFEETEEEIRNGALVVLYHKNLDLIKGRIVNTGGIITKDIFPFPGGRRFHFADPSGNELAVWSDK